MFEFSMGADYPIYYVSFTSFDQQITLEIGRIYVDPR